LLDSALIEQYVASAFHASFLPNDKDETGIHGPFVAERNTAAAFVSLRESELAQYLEGVQLLQVATWRSAPRSCCTSAQRSREIADAMC
jgi:hypothetical protein